MKKKILFLALILSHIGLFAQKNLRDYIVIVRPVYHQSTIDFLNNLSNYVRGKGYKSAADYLKNYAEGKGFGSGFLTKGPDGKIYILTNRHVVMQAEKIKLEFANPDGSKVNYEDCKIIEIDDNSDLALLALPENVNINRYLNISNDQANDGQEVYSAGFPGMAGKPSWQLGKGIVSNSAFQMSSLDEDINTIAIQHTAQIDAGSSGSPLLIADPNQTVGYSVIGLNTWKVNGRESVNLSIPVKAINEFINNAIIKEKLDKNEILERESKQFVNDAMLGYKKIIKYISYDYVSKVNVNGFISSLNKASKEAKEDIDKVFDNNIHPIEAVRIAIADDIAQKIKKNKNSFSYDSIVGTASYNNPTTVILSANNKNVTSSWIIEQNKWKINDLSCASSFNSENHIGFAGESFDARNTFSTDFFFTENPAESFGYGLEYLFSKNYIYYGINVSRNTHYAYYETLVSDYSSYYYTTYKRVVTNSGYASYTRVGLIYGIKIPFQIKKLYLVPFAQGSLGLGFNLLGNNALSAQSKLGINVAYKLKNKNYLQFQIAKSPRLFDGSDSPTDLYGNSSNQDYNQIGYNKGTYSGISFGLGYLF